MVKVLRYQPMPPRNAPPPLPVGLSLSKGSSMLQSCGRSRLRHAASLKAGEEASVASPKKNFHPLLNDCVEGLACASLFSTDNKNSDAASANKTGLFISIDY